jgi:hypothetical protein
MEPQDVECWSKDLKEMVQKRDKAGTCDCGNGPSGSIKCGELLD